MPSLIEARNKQSIMKICTPFFSIILPTHNVEKYIGRSIRSCLSQSFIDFEILVIDDRGNDRSIEIARSFSIKDSRIRIITNDFNLGTFGARNQGILHAIGNYIVFLDPDDELTSNTLERLHKEIIETDADIVLFGRSTHPARRLEWLRPKLQSRTNPVELPIVNIFVDTPKLFWGTPGKAFSSTVAKKTYRNFQLLKDRLTYCEDVLFLFVAAMHAKNYITITEKLYLYHTNPESITSTKKYEDLLKLRQQIDMVINHATKFLATNAELSKDVKAEKSLGYVCQTLRSDKELLFRFESDPNTGNSLYLRSSLNSFRARKNPKDLIRALLHVVTLAKFKF